MNQPSPPNSEPDLAAPAPVIGRLGRVWKRLSPWAALIAIVVCAIAAALAVAAYGGVVAGRQERGARATQTTAADITLQFNLGVQDLEAGRYELAAQRFVWVLDRDPNYPGALENLAEAQRLSQQPAAVEVSATPIPPSQADSLDERFAEAQTLVDDEQWEAAITRLQELRALDPSYHSGEVQQMLYDALVTLGLQYVRGDRLEEGIILLDQAAAIRPLDDLAEGERLLATLYMTGRTYWDLNWPIVIRNFEEIYLVAPNYQDVRDRLWQAYVAYGDQLMPQEGGPCQAVSQYQSALEMSADDEVNQKLEAAEEACANPTPTPEGGVSPDGTPSGTPNGTPPGTPSDESDGTPPPDEGIGIPDVTDEPDSGVEPTPAP
jgi:tetratricopeptide (TPR) repeat protein